MLLGAISGQEPTAQPPPPPTKFIAVGTDNDYLASNIQLTTDGTTWNWIETPNISVDPDTSIGPGPVLQGICTNGSRWVAVGYDGNSASDYGLVITSDDDGYHWTLRSNPYSAVNGLLTAVCWDGTNFIAVGDLSGTATRVMTSPDGTTWTARTSAPSTNVRWFGVAPNENGSAVVAVGRLSAGGVGEMTSTDHGVTWTQHTPSVASSTYLGVANNQQVTADTWCAVSAPSSSTTRIMTSTNDGTSWTQRTGAPTTGIGLWGVVWNGTEFIAVGGDENASPVTPHVMTSPTGTTWTARTPVGAGSVSSLFRGVAVASDGQVMAVGHNGGYSTPIIQSSSDGHTWTSGTPDPAFANVGPFFAIAAAIEVPT